MSLNCKQLKQKYEELLSEKDSFVLEYERFKNGGDDKKVKELKVRLEKNTKEMREVLMFPGSLFLGIKKLVENNNINIEGIINVKVSFDGKLRGVIQSDSKILLFCDDIEANFLQEMTDKSTLVFLYSAVHNHIYNV